MFGKYVDIFRKYVDMYGKYVDKFRIKQKVSRNDIFL
jgi:hypothetical protein